MNDVPQIEMPRYRSHKEVHALKIAQVAMVDGRWVITPEDNRYAPFVVEFEFISKHDPKSGGYYVVYADGYKSFSPAPAFDDGYTLIPPAA